MKVLVAVSDKNEAKGIRASDSVNVVITGVGPIIAAVNTALAIARVNPDVVVNLGSAGTLGRLEVGHVYSFSSVVTPDQNLTAMHLALGSSLDSKRATYSSLETRDRASGLLLLSSGKFNRAITDDIRYFNPDCVDMEGYGVALASRESGRPCYIVKLITDTIGDSSTVGDISYNLREGRERMVRLTESLLSVSLS